MIRRKIPVLIFFLACVVPSAYAQKGYEITPFGGSRFGGVIDVNTQTVDFLTIKSSVNYGVILDVPLWENFQPEFIWNRQPTELATHSPTTGTKTDLTSATLDMYQFGFLYAFRSPEAKLKPFVVGGLGFTHYDSHGALSFSNRFSYNLGLGVKYFPMKHVGLRLETRWSPSRTTSSNTIFCDPFFGCFPATVANHAEQGQANLGVIFRF